MRYLIILLFLVSCGYQVMPDTTTVEYGTTENGKNKTTKGIKQTFKLSNDMVLVKEKISNIEDKVSKLKPNKKKKKKKKSND